MVVVPEWCLGGGIIMGLRVCIVLFYFFFFLTEREVEEVQGNSKR